MPRHRTGRTQRRILDYVRTNPGACAPTIGRALSIRGGGLYDSLRLLRLRGMLQREREGRTYPLYVSLSGWRTRAISFG